jgi:hypothetical protein
MLTRRDGARAALDRARLFQIPKLQQHFAATWLPAVAATV